MASDLGRFVRRIHDLGVTVPGLCAADILIRQTGPGRFQFGLSDPERADCVVPVSNHKRASEFRSLADSVTGIDRSILFQAYAAWTRSFHGLRASFLRS
jgi:hypothetical protein